MVQIVVWRVVPHAAGFCALLEDFDLGKGPFCGEISVWAIFNISLLIGWDSRG